MLYVLQICVTTHQIISNMTQPPGTLHHSIFQLSFSMVDTRPLSLKESIKLCLAPPSQCKIGPPLRSDVDGVMGSWNPDFEEKPRGNGWTMMNLGVSKNNDIYPQIIHFNRVFHYVHHPFWGKIPYFWKHPSRSSTSCQGSEYPSDPKWSHLNAQGVVKAPSAEGFHTSSDGQFQI